jgi:SAM-dependent methyltransferase
MSCCTPTGYRTIFGAKTVERDARRYRRKGLTGSARWLLHALTGEGVRGASVLEVGGGIGGLQIELLNAGAAHATNVEIIDSYEAAAGALIAEHGVAGQVERHIADFAEHPDETPVADIVIMHRVICCYPDPDALVTAACDQARERVAITIPRQAWWVKLGFSTMNAWFRLRRIAFQAYVHPIDSMLEVAAARDFHPAHQERDPFWESLVLQRRTPATPSAAAR